MRKIERDMLQAIYERRDWRANNTAVQFVTSYTAEIRLHGNRIATVDTDDGLVYPDDLTFHQFPTRTTASRLQALGIRAKADCGSGTAILYDESARLPAPDAIR